TTVHTLFGNQMGGRKSYNPKNQGKKSYQPILTFLAETREYISGELRNGDRPTGAQIARHLESVFAALPPQVKTIFARVDSGFYCWDAVEAYENQGVQFIISARKTSRLMEELQAADWKRSPRTDADGQCEFRYQPEGWKKGYRFLALRYEKKPQPREADEPEQYQLFDTPEYSYRVFVTNMKDSIDRLVWFYNQRAGAENLIKEANNDAGLAAHPSGRWMMNCNHFQLALLAYNLNCWLMLFNREGRGQGRNSAAHHAGDRAATVSVSGGQDLAPCGEGRRQLQRPLCRAGTVPPPDGPAAGDRHRWAAVRAGAGNGADGISRDA
ncbi:MAG: transposase, partial [Terriglobales bacterium]